MDPFAPQSPMAQSISNIFILTLWIGAAVLILVTVLVTIAIIRFRHRPGDDEDPKQVYGNRRLEIAWTAAPALLLIFLFALTVKTSFTSDPTVSSKDPDVVVIGHQWWWEIRYPKYGVVTANEVHMPVGQKIIGDFESADVIHDFWVPELGRKIDMIPGHPNQMYIQVDKSGTYLGTCAEYCGTEHAWMRIRVIAQTPEEFAAWIKSQQQVPAVPTTGEAAKGAQLFQAIPCQSCHTIAGTAANGTVGPDLTHFASRQTLGTGVLDNNAGTLTAWLSNPQAIKPGILMPNLKLTNDQITALVAYMETLK